MKLALGAAQFGSSYGISNQTGQVTPEEAKKILSAAKESGIDTIDTAIAYGDSERILGKLGVTDWKIVSKLPALPDSVTDVSAWVDEQITDSLARLGIQQLYAVLLHKPHQLFEVRGKQLSRALENLKLEGKAKKIGVSVYEPNELSQLLSHMNFDLVQAPLNILDRRLVDSGWTTRLKNIGVEIHTRSTFLQGLLLMKNQQRPAKFLKWENFWIEWSRWLQENQLTEIEACLRYVLSLSEINKVVIGVDNTKQLLEIFDLNHGGKLSNLPNWPSPPNEKLINPSHWSSI